MHFHFRAGWVSNLGFFTYLPAWLDMFLTSWSSVLWSNKWEETHLIHCYENWDNVYKTWFQVFSKCYITDEEVGKQQEAEKASEKAAKTSRRSNMRRKERRRKGRRKGRRRRKRRKRIRKRRWRNKALYIKWTIILMMDKEYITLNMNCIVPTMTCLLLLQNPRVLSVPLAK